MGYSTSTTTLNNMRQYLGDLERGVGTRWVLAEGASPQKFAARIREALKIAEENPDYIPALADAKRKFRIEIVDKRTVQAIFKSPQLTVASSDPVVVQGMVHSEKGRPLDVMEPRSAAEVQQVWHNAQPSNERFHFPNSKLSREELTKLYMWCKKERTPELYLILGAGNELTLCPKFKGVEVLEWTPADPDPID